MKKSVFGMVLLGGVLLAGCSCEHTWQEATCTAPKTCTECGETEGEAAAHKLSAATCTKPAACEVCGTTEGNALDHDFLVATCAQPEVCSRCGEERGERLPHEEQFIGECDRCHEIQNRDVVETILSKLEGANGHVAMVRDGMVSRLEALTGEEGYEEREDSTLKDMCIWTETQLYDMFEEPRDTYEEVERLYEEARELCGEYKELADLKEKLWECIDSIPEEMPVA